MQKFITGYVARSIGVLCCFSFLFIFAVINLSMPPKVCAAEPELLAQGAILVDSATGQILYQKNMNDKLYPASTTKILTALLALEYAEQSGHSLSEIVTVSRRATEIGGSRVGLQMGEQLSLEDLLYIMLLSSSNDASIAIAEHVSGTVEQFAFLMNQRAEELGAHSSNFVNPHGMPDENHYITAYDLSVISRKAMENSTFRKIVNTINYQVERKKNFTGELLKKVEKLEERFGPIQENFYNHNRLIGNGRYGYSGAIGIKTGYTVEAGQCMSACSIREDRELIAVLLNSESNDLWIDAATLLDYGYNNFTSVELLESGEIITQALVRGGEGQVELATAKSFNYNVLIGERQPEVAFSVELMEDISIPVNKSDVLGQVVLTAEGQEIGRVSLEAINSVYGISSGTNRWWLWPALTLGFLILLARIVNISARKRRIKRRLRYGR